MYYKVVNRFTISNDNWAYQDENEKWFKLDKVTPLDYAVNDIVDEMTDEEFERQLVKYEYVKDLDKINDIQFTNICSNIFINYTYALIFTPEEVYNQTNYEELLELIEFNKPKNTNERNFFIFNEDIIYYKDRRFYKLNAIRNKKSFKQ